MNPQENTSCSWPNAALLTANITPGRSYLGLGSNLANPRQQVLQSIECITQLPATTMEACSSLYQSTALGPKQPDYINAVVKITTSLPPLLLLYHLQRIEQLMGRRQQQRWQARLIDLDILLYGQLTMRFESLQLPHPGIFYRPFVITPLLEIEPQLPLKTIAHTMTKLPVSAVPIY